MSIAIEFNHVGKQYRLGLVSTRTLSHDLNRWWHTAILKQEDPYLRIGETNDRTAPANHSQYVWALRDIDFKVEQGDVVGIIGKNGAGKSTLLKLLSKVTGPTVGTIRARGRIGALLEVGTGFHPEMTGRENIYMNGAIMGMSKAEVSRKLDEIIDFSGCERYIDTPVKRYSSGMTVRLGFAVAAHLDPEILVVDEVLAVGDAEFQKKAIGKMQQVSKGEGRTVLFVSHNMASVRQLCGSGILLENGTVKFRGTAEETIAKYLSSNVDLNGTALKNRTDKEGDRRIEVSNVIFRNEQGDSIDEVFVGRPLVIDFYFEIKDPSVDLSKLIVACSFTDSYGSPSVVWCSDEMDQSFAQVNRGKLSLHIPNLSLRPNTYSFNYQFSLNSTGPKDWCDALSNAAYLTVISEKTNSSSKIITRKGFSAILPAHFIV